MNRSTKAELLKAADHLKKAVAIIERVEKRDARLYTNTYDLKYEHDKILLAVEIEE